jgi:hypothetical protein
MASRLIGDRGRDVGRCVARDVEKANKALARGVLHDRRTRRVRCRLRREEGVLAVKVTGVVAMADHCL